MFKYFFNKLLLTAAIVTAVSCTIKADVYAKALDEITDYEIPTIDEIRTFVYSMWAKIVADVQTPYGCSGQKKKGIMKHSFREVQKGKFINKNIREIMDAFILKMKTALDI